MNRTFIICKPDAVERGLVGQILSRFETKGFSIVAAELRTLDADTLARHYEEHVGKGFYDDLVAFMSRGPALVAVIEGPEGTWETVREMMGATNPMTSAPGTIRGDFGTAFTENLIHGSDSRSRRPARSASSSPNWADLGRDRTRSSEERAQRRDLTFRSRMDTARRTVAVW